MLRSNWTRNPPLRLGLAYTCASTIGIQEPKSYAVSGLGKEQWLASMASDVTCLEAIASDVTCLEAMRTWIFVLGHNLEKLFLDDGFLL